MALVVSLIILHVLSVQCFPEVGFEESVDGDPGSPLFLTPYIESGKIKEGRELARVSFPALPNLVSYSGFFTVDKAYDSNQFFWYFPPAGASANVTMVWLQGGPGLSSLFGLFEENGPIQVINGTFQKREIPHFGDSKYNLIYIDNPVGAGFSFTNDSRGYATNQTQIGEQLYSTLYQFYQIFPELLSSHLIISGEGYGGKYATSLAHTIHKKNSIAQAQGKSVLPLNGITIGDGWCDPINQLDYGEFLYQIGVFDWHQQKEADRLANITRELIKKEAWRNASYAWDDLIQYINRTAAYMPLFNYLAKDFLKTQCVYCELLKSEKVRKAIHVGDLPFKNFDSESNRFLLEDLMKSVAPWISELLENHKVLTYNGQQDVIVPYPSTTNFLRHLKWSGSQDYEKARRMIILLAYARNRSIHFDEIGFVKIAGKGKLWEQLLRRAGHLVHRDQLLWISVSILVWEEQRVNVNSENNIIYLNLIN